MQPSSRGSHAVVIGGSIAGLLAARALADHFETVTIIERDPIAEQPDPRKGVPQGHHVHALLKSGEQAMNQLFPGFTEMMLSNGSLHIDLAQDVAWYHFRVWKKRYASGFKLVGQTRPFLEWHIVRRLREHKNVNWMSGWSAQALIPNHDKSRITGVKIENGDGQTEDLQVDLVVDASGRGSKTPGWLKNLGYAAPQETLVNINLSYTSRLYEKPANLSLDCRALVLNPTAPDHPRGGYVFEVENNRWIVTLAGYSGEKMPTDDAEFLEYARSLMLPDVYDAIKDATPISEPKTYRYTSEQLRHYERLSRFPDGLIVVGDAYCSFDPVFGQGMSSSAKQALALSDLLGRMSPKDTGFSSQFHRKVGKIISTPWLLATSEDLRFPKTEAARPFWMPILHWYTAHIFRLTGSSERVHRGFMQVMNLLDEPTVLFHPAIVAHVINQAVGRGQKPDNKRPPRPM